MNVLDDLLGDLMSGPDPAPPPTQKTPAAVSHCCAAALPQPAGLLQAPCPMPVNPVQAPMNETRTQQINGLDVGLPPGWACRLSRTTGRVVYMNRSTGQSTFDRPQLVKFAEGDEVEVLSQSLGGWQRGHVAKVEAGKLTALYGHTLQNYARAKVVDLADPFLSQYFRAAPKPLAPPLRQVGAAPLPPPTPSSPPPPGLAPAAPHVIAPETAVKPFRPAAKPSTSPTMHINQPAGAPVVEKRQPPQPPEPPEPHSHQPADHGVSIQHAKRPRSEAQELKRCAAGKPSEAVASVGEAPIPGIQAAVPMSMPSTVDSRADGRQAAQIALPTAEHSDCGSQVSVAYRPRVTNLHARCSLGCEVDLRTVRSSAI